MAAVVLSQRARERHAGAVAHRFDRVALDAHRARTRRVNAMVVQALMLTTGAVALWDLLMLIRVHP